MKAVDDPQRFSCAPAPEEQPFDDIVLRPMEPGDLEQVRSVHEQCFPVQYNLGFYRSVVNGFIERKENGSTQRIHTQVAARAMRDACEAMETGASSEILALVTAHMVPLGECGDLDYLQAHAVMPGHTHALYILTLGVLENYRRSGFGRVLLQTCLDAAAAAPHCAVVYLHVITYNKAAIRFYESAGFDRVGTISDFYSIGGRKFDCFLYAHFLNGARPRPRRPLESIWGLGALTRGLGGLLGLLRAWFFLPGGGKGPSPFEGINGGGSAAAVAAAEGRPARPTAPRICDGEKT